MKKWTWGGVALTLIIGSAAMGAGFQLYTEGSAETLGQAGAVSGRTNMTSQAWYNPSALAGAKRPALMVGSAFASIHTDFKSAVSPVADDSMSDEWRMIPHLYYVQPLSDKLTGTLSINAPYGLITEWDDGWTAATIATYSDLEAIYITPSIAWQVTEILAVSAGLNVVDAKADLQRTGSRVEGDDIHYGGTFSAHLQPLDDWGFGLRYQSRVKLDITGKANGTFPASAELELPSTVNFGVANTTIKNLTLGLDLVWTEWSTYDELSIVTPAEVVTASKDWDDVISIRLGAEYALGEDWKIRGGYVWDESPIPDSTRAPEMPGTDRQMITMGFGWQFWNSMTLDAAYAYLWADKGDMGTDNTALNPGLAGSFETTTHLLAVSLGYTF
ncbi:OmpP1/FadL family transporter [Pontiella agarivorans]|uniref:TonB-dependent receptor n=1 Tax=Pontiella agarivorans TaxID=3038953 RepID=A0ABU5MXN3_9BACT|nr:outer membrane protein transport protein [Pontiella agarivorans]MDZ8118831.1 TonB-dependent receptor [Pontiella agarivorans]